MNFTIQLPEGTTNHGDPHLICTPPTRKDMLVFYLGNYFIHAATLPTAPGETKAEIIFAVLNALFIPGFGALRVVRRLTTYPSLRRRLSPIEKACASGALCMVVHRSTLEGSWDQGESGDATELLEANSWAFTTFKGHVGSHEVAPFRNIHGVCDLPDNYQLCVVPFGVRLRPAGSSGSSSSSNASFRLASDYSVVKALFSLVQIIVGSITIYRARGDQITQYGYAAFGLSTVPYVFMSAVNAIASVLSPTYPAMYLVRTPDMDRAENEDGGHFEGIVAELIPRNPAAAAAEDNNNNNNNSNNTSETPPPPPLPNKVYGSYLDTIRGRSSALVIFLLSFAIPMGLVSGLSGGLQPGLISTTDQRAWLMSWIVVGSLSSVVAWFFQLVFRTVPAALKDDESYAAYLICFLPFVAPLWMPAIGGMISVGAQLQDYGICTRFE